jgi:hypothetical protein
MTKPFNIHDWQAKQRLNEAQYGKYFGKDDDFKGAPVGSGSEYEPTDANQEVINGRIMGEIFDLVRHNNLDPEDVMEGFADEFNIAFEFGRASGMTKQAGGDGDDMHDNPGDIRIDHDYYTEQNTIAAASSGASVTTGDGMGYMSSNTFGKKRKKVNEQDPKMSDDQLAQWRKDNIDKPEEVPETKYSKDVEFILKYISKIDNKTEWGELMKVLVDLPIKDIKPTGKGIIIRNLLNSL